MVRIISKRNKYGNVPTYCHQGIKHPAKGEANHCNLLHLEMRSKGSDVIKIEHERPYRLCVSNVLISVHKPDWTLTHVDGHSSIVEFKGHPTPAWRLKHKHTMAQYPHIPYLVVK